MRGSGRGPLGGVQARSFLGTVTSRAAANVGAATEAVFAEVVVPAAGAGDTLDVEVWGNLTCGTADDWTLRFKVGATTVTTHGPAIIASNANVRRWTARLRIVLTAVDAQQARSEIQATTGAAGGASAAANLAGSAFPTGIAHGSAAVDFAAPVTLSATVEWETNAANQQIVPAGMTALLTKAA